MKRLLVGFLALASLTSSAMEQVNDGGFINKHEIDLKPLKIAEEYKDEHGYKYHFKNVAGDICRSHGYDFFDNYETIPSDVLISPQVRFMSTTDYASYFDRNGSLRNARTLEWWGPSIITRLTCIEISKVGSVILKIKKPSFKEYAKAPFSYKSDKNAVCKYLGFDKALASNHDKFKSKKELIVLGENENEEIKVSKKYILDITCKRDS